MVNNEKETTMIESNAVYCELSEAAEPRRRAGLDLSGISYTTNVGCLSANLWILILGIASIVLYVCSAFLIATLNTYNALKIIASICGFVTFCVAELRGIIFYIIMFVIWFIIAVLDVLMLTYNLLDFRHKERRDAANFVENVVAVLVFCISVLPIDVFFTILYYRLYRGVDQN
ncbi:unnamed protein product [Caenorhabditis bovis]|uniref:Uncharacterized protein n=1 Tax=Caenorhabditis bovis TaxID=2654633 RepID=A0A8S1EMF1_9PELO|nr:unnamed protein product [Caenorhabditis bovis]